MQARGALEALAGSARHWTFISSCSVYADPSVPGAAEDAELLQAPPFSPAFFITRAGFDARGRVIEYAESLYRGDRYDYELSVRRRGPREGA